MFIKDLDMDLANLHSNDNKLESTIDSILFVIVLYKSNLQNSISFTSLTSEVKNNFHHQIDIVIYDNSPQSMYEQNEYYECWNIHYIHNPSNPGVSKAYNEAAKLGKELHKKWLLLLDQDTNFPNDALRKYCLAVRTNYNIPLFVPILVSKDGNIYSPCRYRFKRGFTVRNVEFGLQKLSNKSVLNSGMLINLDIFHKIGGYNEKLMLDFSDFDFIDKYRKVSNNFYVIETKCIHELSSTENDFDKSLNRFVRYCISMNFIAKFDFDTITLFLITLVRACKLSIKFGNLSFLSIFFKNLFFSTPLH